MVAGPGWPPAPAPARVATTGGRVVTTFFEVVVCFFVGVLFSLQVAALMTFEEEDDVVVAQVVTLSGRVLVSAAVACGS